MKLTAAILVGLLCLSTAFAQDDAAPPPEAPTTRTTGNGTQSSTAQGPVAFGPTSEVTASAPNPAASVRARTGDYALDSLANTPTSYNQIQTIGVYSAAHVAPSTDIRNYLANVTDVPGLTTANAPNSTAFTQLQLYNQLEYFGARAFHFRIFYDPTGKLYQLHAGLAIVNQSANTSTSDDKWTYPGWKVMQEPNFDFNSTCINLFTCLFNIKNWILTTPRTVPITIFLEPSTFTYTGNATDANATFASALSKSSADGAPTSLNQPIDVTTYEPINQPWRDLENEILNVFDRNSYFTIVTPDDIMDDEDTLKDAVLKEDYTLYPSLNNLRSRIFFVLTGQYVPHYLAYYPDLKNATLFISEPYNADKNFTDSTLFVDVTGPLPGANASTFTSTSARNASQTVAAQISDAVKAGYMVRASADWQTVEPRNNYSTRATDVIQAGAHFVQTSFPTTPTLFPSTYSLALPIRGNQKQAARCNPVTTGGVFFNATEVYSVGCPALSNAPGAAPASSI